MHGVIQPNNSILFCNLRSSRSHPPQSSGSGHQNYAMIVNKARMLRPLIRAAHSAVPTKPNRVKTSRPQFRTAALRTFSATRYVTDDQHTTQHADSTVTRDLTDDQRPTPLAGAVTDQMNSFKWPHKTIERDLVNEENSPIITRALIGSCGIDIELMECFRGELEFLLFNSEIKGVGTDGGKDVAVQLLCLCGRS